MGSLSLPRKVSVLGSTGSIGVSTRPVETRCNAACIWLIKLGISEAGVGLLLR